jgi:hypothetical protein
MCCQGEIVGENIFAQSVEGFREEGLSAEDRRING